MIQTNFGQVHQRGEGIRKALVAVFICFLFVAAPAFQAYPAEPTYPIPADVYTTRDRTVTPVSIPDAPHLAIKEVDQYETNGYTSWTFGSGVDYGRLLPDGSPVGAFNPVETLLTYFSISDTHITDKEAPAQGLLFGWTEPLETPVCLLTHRSCCIPPRFLTRWPRPSTCSIRGHPLTSA